jgi:hypothetical protein
MSVRFTRFLLVLSMLIFPMQGMASAVHALACTPHADHTAASVPERHAQHQHAAYDRHHSHDHEAGDHGAPHGHSGGSDGGGDHSSHQCCHHLSSATTSSPRSGADIDLPVFQPALSLLETLFFPEQPQRPPRI